MSRNSLFPKKKKRFVLKQVTHKKVDTLTLEDRQSLKENQKRDRGVVGYAIHTLQNDL